ncbi:hypothetical protein [Diaphorobacter sp.]
MRTHITLTAIAMLVAALGAPALAGDRDHRQERNHARERAMRCADNAGQGMQVVPNDAGAQERAHGWQYFSDPAACRAVVISPQGDYYFSQGRGLRWVAAAQPDA